MSILVFILKCKPCHIPLKYRCWIKRSDDMRGIIAHKCNSHSSNIKTITQYIIQKLLIFIWFYIRITFKDPELDSLLQVIWGCIGHKPICGWSSFHWMYERCACVTRFPLFVTTFLMPTHHIDYWRLTFNILCDICNNIHDFFLPKKSVKILVFLCLTGYMLTSFDSPLSIRGMLQGSGDFWAPPAKIRPFTTSTGFFQDWPVANLLSLIWTGQYPIFLFKCRLFSSL